MYESIVFKATSGAGEVCHFGTLALAKAWAGKTGFIEQIVLHHKEATKRRISYVCPCCNFSMIRNEDDKS